MANPVIIGLTLIGITILLVSIIRSVRIVRLLNANVYDSKFWMIIIFMLFGFVAGYSLLIFEELDLFTNPIAIELVVALVYFFGSIFTFVTTRVVMNNFTSILGKRISNDDAIQRFLTFANMTHSGNGIDFEQRFEIVCEHCEKPIKYSIPEIVRSNVVALDRGISVEDIFGTKSYILRPAHKCDEGRREYTVVHDKNLEIRSIEGSRIIYGGNL